MLKISFIALIFVSIILLNTCEKDTSPISGNPQWLDNYIDNIKNDHSYSGAIIYLYKWKENSYYDVFVPQSSCVVCEVYDVNGNKMEWDDDSAVDYINNRKEISTIWRWQNNN